MATPSAIPNNPSSDGERIYRLTKGGRHLWYQMKVLQQPERARACGSGMKANSDRRPVDPPPVVELRIIEGPTFESGKDITFDYNANFFLYASLEHARPIVHGRVQTPAATVPPILTGVPASGMAYLDRPTEAGYFIFPDLSVRHEGLYVLTFSLFETTKEEKDFDPKPPEGDLPPGVDWRMEIKTAPFNVFSAKKFPGLMESTPLSKCVADQGCRVRIRRDVRMRKRDTKSNGYDRREEDHNRHRTVTPAPTEDHHSIRARSLSNSSEQRAPYVEPQRRPSAVEAYTQPPPPPHSYDHNQAPRGHLSFGGDSAVSQYAAPPQHYPHPAQPQIAPMSPGVPYPSTQSPYVKQEVKPYGYAPTRPPRALPPTCQSPIPPMKSEPHDRRQSANFVPPSPSTFSSLDGHSRRDSLPSYPATPISAHPPPRTHGLPSSSSLDILKISALTSPSAPIEAQSETLPPPPVMHTGGKRKHDLVFSQNDLPLYNGQRQVDPHYGGYRRLPVQEPEPDSGYYKSAAGHMKAVTFNTFLPHP